LDDFDLLIWDVENSLELIDGLEKIFSLAFVVFFNLLLFGNPEINDEGLGTAENSLVIKVLNGLLGFLYLFVENVGSLKISVFFLPNTTLEDPSVFSKLFKNCFVSDAGRNEIDKDVGVEIFLHLLRYWRQGIAFIASYFVLFAVDMFADNYNFSTG
jgi:hypothetical protein